jgi:hypothetical protein
MTFLLSMDETPLLLGGYEGMNLQDRRENQVNTMV